MHENKVNGSRKIGQTKLVSKIIKVIDTKQIGNFNGSVTNQRSVQDDECLLFLDIVFFFMSRTSKINK